jgi:hypothetical protein
VKTVRELAEEIDDRLMDLASEKGQRAACAEALAIAEVAVRDAEQRVLHARVALFEAYPELLGGETLESLAARASGERIAVYAGTQAEPVAEYEAIDVDDPDVLPRGERAPDPSEGDDLADLWSAHDE